MKSMSLIAAVIAGAAQINPFNTIQPCRRGKGRIDKSGLPSGYPGAKMARKAIQQAVAVKHPRGLRTNDIGFAQQ